MQLLVNFSRESIQSRLVTNLYKPELFAELLHEDEALVTERTRIQALLDAYKEAFKWVALLFSLCFSFAVVRAYADLNDWNVCALRLVCRVLSDVSIKSL